MPELTGMRALVTGASSGLGVDFARQLAARGASVVLTARRQTALDAVAAELRRGGATVEVIVEDLGVAGGATALWTRAQAGGPIDILINNAGFGYFRDFAREDVARDTELVQLNVASLVELCHHFVTANRARAERTYIVNVASVVAFQAVPSFASYAASKAFVLSFSEAIHDELRASTISVTCVCPGGTKTEFHARAGAGDYGRATNAAQMAPAVVVAMAIRAMLRRRRLIVTGVGSKLTSFAVRLVPRRMAAWAAQRIMGRPRDEALPARRG